jgi:hypothetical protein
VRRLSRAAAAAAPEVAVVSEAEWVAPVAQAAAQPGEARAVAVLASAVERAAHPEEA